MEEPVKSGYVIDSSFILAYILPDERVEKVDAFFDQLAEKESSLCAPRILSFEVANGIKSAVTQKRITLSQARSLLKAFLLLSIIEASSDLSNIIEVAHAYQLSVYDAAYISLSLEKQLPLLTLDRKLARTALSASRITD